MMFTGTISPGAKIDHINKYLILGQPLSLGRDGSTLTVGYISTEGWAFTECIMELSVESLQKPSEKGATLLIDEEVNALYTTVTQEIKFGVG